MNLDQITPECFILSLFIRDDGERFLLGDGAYTFKDNQQHFVANSYANDVVEVQGNDGVFLAGQVRRASSQSFDGYVGDATVSKPDIEEYRKDFLAFFRKNYYYTVVYIFPNGDVIQRRKGFIVDAPEVKELFQIHPEYHIALNFEDVNYYSYSEDPDGNEKYTKSATIYLSTGASSGGLVWDNIGAVSNNYTWITPVEIEGSEIEITNSAGASAPIKSIQFKGDTEQQNYSGRNLISLGALSGSTTSGVAISYSGSELSMNGTSTGSNSFNALASLNITLPAGTYTASLKTLSGSWTYPSSPSDADFAFYILDAANVGSSHRLAAFAGRGSSTWWGRSTFTLSEATTLYFYGTFNTAGIAFSNLVMGFQIEQGSATTYEPYTGGIPAPNPNYPQPINVVTGEQTVTITDGEGQSQSYEVNLGKNLFNKNGQYLISGGAGATVDVIDTGVKVTYGTSGSAVSARFMIGKASSLVGKTITLSTYITKSASGLKPGIYIGVSTADLSSVERKSEYVGGGVGTKTVSWTVTEDSTKPYIMVSLYVTNGGTYTQGDYTEFENCQLEVGSTATSYADYFEPIELCKIGDYQDYIYKSGDDWYIHKTINRVILGDSENPSDWYTVGSTQKVFAKITRFGAYSTSTKWIISDKYLGVARNNIGTNTICLTNDGDIRFDTGTTYTDVNTFLSFLSSNNVLAYYVLVTPTDTQITNSALINQLDTLAGAELAVGENNIVVTAAGSNLPSILDLWYYTQIDYGGAGYEWEAGSGAGPTTVMVDSIDRVYPVWEVTGPADNPQLSVLTTNTTIRYSGTVTASQTLVIDMFNKTAKLNGTSVIGNVSGDWLYFDAGNNRVTYTTNNADANPSTIYWQEVVG